MFIKFKFHKNVEQIDHIRSCNYSGKLVLSPQIIVKCYDKLSCPKYFQISETHIVTYCHQTTDTKVKK